MLVTNAYGTPVDVSGIVIPIGETRQIADDVWNAYASDPANAGFAAVALRVRADPRPAPAPEPEPPVPAQEAPAAPVEIDVEEVAREFMRTMRDRDPAHANDAWWTQSGAPEVRYLRANGIVLTARERDLLWSGIV